MHKKRKANGQDKHQQKSVSLALCIRRDNKRFKTEKRTKMDKNYYRRFERGKFL